jgi:hypothetical protein
MLTDRELANFRNFTKGIPLRHFSPGGAFDAKPSRRGRDEEGGQPNAIEAMLELRAKMSPEGFKALCAELCGGEAEDESESEKFETPEAREAAQGKDRRRAKDAPPDFPGCPKTGAMDMAFDGPPRRKSKAEASFAKMFGESALGIKNADPYPIASRTRT